MEWLDHLSKGNGSDHWILDEIGRKVLGYRLSDYGSTNKVYVLRLCDGEKKEYIKVSAVSVIKRNYNGDSVGSKKFVLKYAKDVGDVLVSLPVEFAPEKKGDIITIEIECISSNRKHFLLSTRLTAKSVWHYPSI